MVVVPMSMRISVCWGSLLSTEGLENGKGMHAYICYQCTDKGVPDVKSYFSSELYHRARYAAVLDGHAGGSS